MAPLTGMPRCCWRRRPRSWTVVKRPGVTTCKVIRDPLSVSPALGFEFVELSFRYPEEAHAVAHGEQRGRILVRSEHARRSATDEVPAAGRVERIDARLFAADTDSSGWNMRTGLGPAWGDELRCQSAEVGEARQETE